SPSVPSVIASHRGVGDFEVSSWKEGFMLKLRLAILGASAALALGTAGVLAMTESSVSGDRDNHGDAVASAARNCPHGATGVHGACVSAIASTNGQAHRDGQQSARVHAGQADRKSVV